MLNYTRTGLITEKPTGKNRLKLFQRFKDSAKSALIGLALGFGVTFGFGACDGGSVASQVFHDGKAHYSDSFVQRDAGSSNDLTGDSQVQQDLTSPHDLTTDIQTAPLTPCTDGDGFDIFTKGKIMKKDGTVIEDTCFNEYLLNEGICYDGCSCTSISINCPQGTGCDGGACKPDNENCIDTDSISGPNKLFASSTSRNIFTQGTLTHKDQNGNLILQGSDNCASSNELNEYVCANDSASTVEKIKCPENTTCVNGACTPSINCLELVPGTNNAVDKSRINLVFVGADFEPVFGDSILALKKLRTTAKMTLGLHSNVFGLLTTEPFKSLKSKFNFWYINKFTSGPSARNSSGELDAKKLSARSDYIRKRTLEYASACDLNKKIVINLIAIDGENYAHPSSSSIVLNTILTKLDQTCMSKLNDCLINFPDKNGDGCLSFREDYPFLQLGAPWYNLQNYCGSKTYGLRICPNDPKEYWEDICSLDELGVMAIEALPHELAHITGIADEYSPYDNVFPHSLSAPNCFVAKTKQDCLDHAPWKGMIGQGCGDPSKSDCSSSDIDYGKEVGCYEGCGRYSKQIYRSIPFGEMMYGVGSPTNVAHSTSFGSYVEKYLSDFLSNVFNKK
jgi:hypothetical protein